MAIEAEIPKGDVGVLVGRFQVPELHEGHKALIQWIADRHGKIIILLGCSPVLGSRHNPLDFTTRAYMINNEFPNISIIPITDYPSDEVWSENVDKAIKSVYPTCKPILYGSRDAFIPYYSGKFPTVALETTFKISGTEIRKQVSEEVKRSEDFRMGVIYSTYNRFPINFMVVDLAILKKDKDENYYILLARKPLEEGWRLIGGFVDPNDKSLKTAVIREGIEETGNSIEFSNTQYIDSFRINDYRYRGEDKVMSALFCSTYKFGAAMASDDIKEVCWHPLTVGSIPEMVESHEQLFKAVREAVKNGLYEIN